MFTPTQTKQSNNSSNDKEFAVGFIPHKSGTYRIEIDSAIEGVEQFSSAIQVMDMAKEDDDIEIYLQCPGGCVNSTDALIHAMRKCVAPIHIVATGGCHSAATHILIEADSFELSGSFNSLIHCGSDGAYGNVNEYSAKASFDAHFRTRQFKKTYEGFLSETELEEVLKGCDIWLDAEAWHTRAVARNEYLRAKFDAQALAEIEKQRAEQEAAELAADLLNESVGRIGPTKKKTAAKKKLTTDKKPVAKN